MKDKEKDTEISSEIEVEALRSKGAVKIRVVASNEKEVYKLFKKVLKTIPIQYRDREYVR